MSERTTRDFWATAHGERAAEWRQVLGTDTVAVLSPIPERADLPGRPGALIYLMDLGALLEEGEDPAEAQQYLRHQVEAALFYAPPPASEADEYDLGGRRELEGDDGDE